MEIFYTMVGSSVLMGIAAIFFAVLCIHALIHGVLGGASTILRILCTLLFAALAYYCYRHAMAIHRPNIIDSFVFDSWHEFKNFLSFLKTKI